MKIEHVAIWTTDLEKLRSFYETYFSAACGPKYHNMATRFESYFLSFQDGARLEIMSNPDVDKNCDKVEACGGYAHFAFSLPSPEAVNRLTETMRNQGIPIVSGPRYTGDGYYESCVLDPDGNRIELVA